MKSIEDRPAFKINGFFTLLIMVLSVPISFIFIGEIFTIAIAITIFICLTGFTIVAPNEAKVITFFGKYIGTIKDSGFQWTIPLSAGQTVTLKIINFNTKELKVNDLKGNPIEVGAVVVWRVKDAAQAAFNVDYYKEFVANQSESAVRAITAKYPYDSEHGESLRGSAGEIAEKLAEELQSKMAIAGVNIEEVKLTHLAYSPEIAASMLKRQQAEAVLQARKYLVENALSIVDTVMIHMQNKGINSISDDKKAEVINNLLVTLTSDQDASPVISVG